MTLEHISSEIQENRNGRKKVTFNKDLQMLQSAQLPLEDWVS